MVVEGDSRRAACGGRDATAHRRHHGHGYRLVFPWSFGPPWNFFWLHHWAAATLGLDPLNTQLFRCLQMLQDPRMTREFRPFLRSPATEASTFSHQSSKEMSWGWGASGWGQTAGRGRTRIVSRTHTRQADVGYFLPLDRRTNIWLDEGGLVELVCRLSSSDCGRPASVNVVIKIFVPKVLVL